MLALAFFSWWYGQGWKLVASSFRRRLRKVVYAFSISLLLRTMFAPWRRIVSYPGTGLSEHLRAWGDNLVSRVIGFIVRLLVIVAALVILLLVTLVNIIELAIWPLLPILPLACLVLGVSR